MINEEDELIANGLKKIRDGLIKNDILLVYEGYNDISGENLEPPKKVYSRLEQIRNAIVEDNLDIKPEKVKKTPKTPKKEIIKDEELGDNIAILENKQSGGKRFGQGQITIISNEQNQDEIEQNKKIVIARNKQITPRKTFEVPNSLQEDEGAIRLGKNSAIK